MKMEEFIHEYIGFSGVPSRCHIRILDGANLPLVIMCSQFPEKSGTSVTNMAEYIASDVLSYLKSGNISISRAVQIYVKENKLSKIMDDLVNKLKETKSITVFTLESIKLAIEHMEQEKQHKKKLSQFVWVEHYPPGTGLLDNGSYAVVNFDPETWEPSWRYLSINDLVKITGYSKDCFDTPKFN